MVADILFKVGSICGKSDLLVDISGNGGVINEEVVIGRCTEEQRRLDCPVRVKVFIFE